MKQQEKTLPIKSMREAIQEAKDLINLERSGKITGLYTRWSKVNKALMKYLRFRSVTCIAGMSGSGKSAILNMIEDDFTNPELNPSFVGKITLLAFKYEMDASDEILRNLSGKVKKSYSYLLSSEAIGEGKEYNKITDEEAACYERELDKLENRPIKYIENAGNLEQLWNTCVKEYQENPNKRLIVTIDHTLLSQKLSEKDDLELAANTAQVAIRLRKYLNAIVIFINQLNGEIEKPIRRENPSMHYPVKTDIHCGNQIYWACDNVFIFHRPEILHILKYGNVEPLNTKNLIHGALIKSRKNKIGNLFFEQRFNEGNMVQINKESKIYKSESFNFGITLKKD